MAVTTRTAYTVDTDPRLKRFEQRLQFLFGALTRWFFMNDHALFFFGQFENTID